MYDDHRYYKWDGSVEKSQAGYLRAACSDNRGGPDDLIVGEWSLQVADELEQRDDFEVRSGKNNEFYRRFWGAQVRAFEKSRGWVFWTWKCNWINGFNDWRWCYQCKTHSRPFPCHRQTNNGEQRLCALVSFRRTLAVLVRLEAAKHLTRDNMTFKCRRNMCGRSFAKGAEFFVYIIYLFKYIVSKYMFTITQSSRRRLRELDGLLQYTARDSAGTRRPIMSRDIRSCASPRCRKRALDAVRAAPWTQQEARAAGPRVPT